MNKFKQVSAPGHQISLAGVTQLQICGARARVEYLYRGGLGPGVVSCMARSNATLLMGSKNT